MAKIGTIIGPGVGGIAVATIGADYTFAVTAVAFFIGTSLLLGITEKPRQEVLEDRPTFFFELKEGFKLVWEIKWIAASIFMATFQLMVIVAAETVLLPVITRREFNTNSTFAIS